VKILVAIASHGTRNDRYLCRLVSEYQRMPFDVEIVVLSDLAKEVAPGVQLVIGAPTRDPCSLPFRHKQIFSHRLKDYDLFVYSEDDTLVTERNIRAFLEVSRVLGENEVAGFLRFEEGIEGHRNFPDMFGHFHWRPESVRLRGRHIFASFTNQHSAFYILSRNQLKRAIDSGGFLVGPHEGMYDLLCTAATDPYTQCGLQKVICISSIENFTIHHLSNHYVGTLGMDDLEFRRQIDCLMTIGETDKAIPLIGTETKLWRFQYSKDYYEPVRAEVVNLIPSNARSVLSVGCGSGALEKCLAQRGMRVVAIPLDPVIASRVDSEGFEVINGDFDTAVETLKGQAFDCLILPNVLHLLDDPDRLLACLAALQSDSTITIIVVPHVLRIRRLLGKIFGNFRFRGLGTYQPTGLRCTSPKIILKWLVSAGMTLQKVVWVREGRLRRLRKWRSHPGELIAVAGRAR
jgi:2-polyprenyl-3-methyl-5-hydroxy-6-metoxy-1,4-benzoquinol methylase